jgi:predicted amidohydrolase
LKVTLVQTPIFWENAIANTSAIEEKLWQHHTETDIIILPEMFNNGFSMNTALVAEPMNLHTTKWMIQLAKQMKALVIGSIPIKEGNEYFNRLLAVFPEGNILHYDKKHLFQLGNEHLNYTSGDKKLIFNYKGWNICPMICYDLRFPVWCRNTHQAYDLLIFVANWPVNRILAWNTLLKARAIENVSYVAGVNRIGSDPMHTSYTGESAMIDYSGKMMAYMSSDEKISTITISHQSLSEFRQNFSFHLDADEFVLS